MSEGWGALSTLKRVSVCLLHSLVGVEDKRASGEGSELGAELVQSFQEVPGDRPLQEKQEPSCSLPHSRRLCGECIIRPSVITSLDLPRTLRLPPPNLPYKFILLKKLKMSVFCEHCINELSPRMTEGGKEEEARRTVLPLSLAQQRAGRGCFLCRKRTGPLGSAAVLRRAFLPACLDSLRTALGTFPTRYW